ncbi:MAG: hypothetical protein LBD11_01835 [Candidatus Peribacteria bacterium]|nr:hypothetical protein [Candidatus Peribacteria bacterium]
MEKHTSSSSKSTSLYKVLSTLAIASVFFSCNPKSDTSTTGHSDTLPTDVPEIVVPEKFGTPQKLPDNVATRVYKLGIASMNDVYLDFREAQVKIETTPALKDLFTHQLFIFEDILPLIIKESRMQSDAVSKSNARGYTQLRSIAIEEVYRKYPELKKLNLDVNCGKDNIILGYVYL